MKKVIKKQKVTNTSAPMPLSKVTSSYAGTSFTEPTLNINPCGIKFNNEDMNLLVDKLNEVISYLNK